MNHVAMSSKLTKEEITGGWARGGWWLPLRGGGGAVVVLWVFTLKAGGWAAPRPLLPGPARCSTRLHPPHPPPPIPPNLQPR